MCDRLRIVTIDGPSGGGKSTVSRALASRLGYTYLDTGAMYRALALKAQRQSVSPVRTHPCSLLQFTLVFQHYATIKPHTVLRGCKLISGLLIIQITAFHEPLLG